MECKPCSTYSHGYDVSLKLDLSFMDDRGSANAAAPRPSSALARGVRITEVSGKINPEPTVADETEFLIEEFLSPRKLRALTGLDNLEEVRFLEMKVDTSETSLGNFGALLPNLSQLKLSNSIIASIRDLGSSFSSLRVLWMARCGLQDVDGVSAMSSLKELYLAYNEVSDISPISMLDQLDTLDLEGNNIDDISQIEFLSLCTSLRSLTIEGNPVCLTPHSSQAAVGYDYRYAVKRAVPGLQVLDDEPLIFPAASSTVASHEPVSPDNNSGGRGSSAHLSGPFTSASFAADWSFLLELEKDGTVMPPGSDAVSDYELPSAVASAGAPGTALRPAVAGYRPGTAMRPTSAMKRIGTAARTGTAAHRLSTAALPSASARGPSPGADGAAALDDASALTQGGVVCGNPSRALKARHSGRHSSTLQHSGSEHPAVTQLLSQFKHASESPVEEQTELIDENVDALFVEIKEWREQHEELHKKIEASRAPQVLKIDYEERALEDGEEFGDEGNDDGDEEVGCSPLCGRCNRSATGGAEGLCACRSSTDEAFLPEEADSGFRSRSDVTATPDDADALSSPGSLTDGSVFPPPAAITAAHSAIKVVTPPTPPEGQPRPGGRRRFALGEPSRPAALGREPSPSRGTAKDESTSRGAVVRPSSGPVPAPVSYEKFRMEPDYDKSKPKVIDHGNPIVRAELRSPEKPVLDRSSRTAAAAAAAAAGASSSAVTSRMRRQLPAAPAVALPPRPSFMK